MEKEPLLSVIVPVYNTHRYLERCIESLSRQTYRNLEIILIDDGSTDDSPAACDAFAAAMENVRVLHKKNAGLGFARNSGLDLAAGEYVAFVDSDDYVEDNMYQRLMEECKRVNADAVFCEHTFIRNDGIGVPMKSSMEAGVYSGRQILRAMMGADPEARLDFDFNMSAWMGIYSRNVLEAAALRFSSERKVISEDFLFNMQFLQKAETVAYIKDCLYCYCENTGSLTRRYIQNRLSKEKDLYGMVRELLEGEVEDADWLRYHRLFLGRIRSTICQEVYYEKSGSLRERIRAIRQIARDDLVCSVIESYPIHRNPIKLRIFNAFLKWKFCIGMYVLIVLKR